MSNQVAQTILAQLGGERFRIMTGANSFASGEFDVGPGLSMKIPGGNGVIITLNGKDLYDIKMVGRGQFRRGEWIPGKEKVVNDVDCEALPGVFESMTGLLVSF